MCGITGIAYFSRGKEVRPRDIEVMNDAIKHRGPDDGGFFISKNKKVGLGNRN